MSKKFNYGQVASSPQKTHQSQPAPGREREMAKNDAGGYSFITDKWVLLRRFLILGTEKNGYYTSAELDTKRQVDSAAACLKENGKRVVDMVVEVSTKGLAPKNDPAILVLAMASSEKFANEATRKYAMRKMPEVCRIGTHLFTYVEFVQNFRGWGRGLRLGVANWYLEKDPQALAYQVIKYQQRNGWSHRDVLRVCHAGPRKAEQSEIFSYITSKAKVDSSALEILNVAAEIPAYTEKQVIEAIHKYNLPREIIPTQHLNSKVVWEALLYAGKYGMPMTAMIRNLNKMTSIGLISPMSDASRFIAEKLRNDEAIKAARIHPIQVLTAFKVYGMGRSPERPGSRSAVHSYFHGSSQPARSTGMTWNPDRVILDALDDAFYKAFDYLAPTRKRLCISVDVSGSMGIGVVEGSVGLTARDVAACMAMAVMKTEPYHEVYGFSSQLVKIPINARMRLDEVINTMARIPYGATDCSLPMQYALTNKIPFDAFIIYTDGDTWIGNEHPFQALERYRKTMGINAKSIVSVTRANMHSIADPKDPNSLDIAGFDSSVPSVISEFIQGGI